jgi:rhamnosyltransferase
VTAQCGPRVGAIVVFYHPDEHCIRRANRLAESIACVVVDNTPDIFAVDGLSPRVRYLPCGDNLGIAAALNRGIAELLREGYDAALLFDQDSEPGPELLKELPKLLNDLRSCGEQVAIVAPSYNDERLGGVAPFVRFKPFRLQRVPASGHALIDADFLITSGSCLNLNSVATIGPMDDSLFIDFVDLEWCIRAKRAGYRLLGVPWLTMNHELGGEPVVVLGRTYPMHSPIRHYYLFRNAIALILRSYVPWSWKSTELVKLPFRLIIYAAFPTERAAHVSMAFRGMLDGLRGRLGRL